MNNAHMPAGRWRRLGATIVDAILVPSLTILFVLVTGVVEDAEDYSNNLWMLWVLLLAIASYLVLNGYLLWRAGQTIGKKLLGVAIVTYSSWMEDSTIDPIETCTKADFWKLICIRALFFPLLFTVVTPLVFLPVLDQIFIFGKKRRCLHDLAAGPKSFVYSIIRNNPMKIALIVALVLNALTELMAAASLIGGPTGISAAGAGQMWSMHYGFAALAIASISIWIWPQRHNLQAVTPALLTLIVFHVGLCCSLTLAGDQFVGSVIHAVLAVLFVTVFFRRATYTTA